MYKIKCPNCSAEYTPQEIFVMSAFNNSKIVKDEDGKILDTFEYDTDESYKCDYCNKTFNVTMKMTFDVKQHEVEEYTTRLHKPSIFLSED